MGLDRLVLGKKQEMTIEELRPMVPLRNPSVESKDGDDGAMLLVAPLDQQGRGLAAVVARWLKMPATKTFELEPVGALVWSLCDGQHTVEAIRKTLQARYKMNRLEAEAALTAFLRMLGQRRLISLMPGKKGK